METMITIAKNSNNEDFIKYAHSLGVRLYRFNMDYEAQALSAINTVKGLHYSDCKLLADFQGVKMRIQLKPGDNDIHLNEDECMNINTTTTKGYPYITNFDNIRNLVKEGQKISIADDKIAGTIINVSKEDITIRFSKVCYVLRQNAGVSITGQDIPLPHMTAEACSLIAKSKTIKDKMVDWIILSFVDSAEAIHDFVQSMHKVSIKVMAKIETPNGVRNIEEIAKVADGFMVGRGDLTSTSGGMYDRYYHEALTKLSKTSNIFKGVGTFFLSQYSKTKDIVEREIKDVEEVKSFGFDYIMLSKEVVNCEYPYETINLLQKLCNK